MKDEEYYGPWGLKKVSYYDTGRCAVL